MSDSLFSRCRCSRPHGAEFGFVGHPLQHGNRLTSPVKAFVYVGPVPNFFPLLEWSIYNYSFKHFPRLETWIPMYTIRCVRLRLPCSFSPYSSFFVVSRLSLIGPGARRRRHASPADLGARRQVRPASNSRFASFFFFCFCTRFTGIPKTI